MEHEDDNNEETNDDALCFSCLQQQTGESRHWRGLMFHVHCCRGIRCHHRMLKGKAQQQVDNIEMLEHNTETRIFQK